jgi:hypothetical protein
MEEIPLSVERRTRRIEQENAQSQSKIRGTVRKNVRAGSACTWRQVRCIFFALYFFQLL